MTVPSSETTVMTRSSKSAKAPWGFLAPAIVLFAAVFVIPIGYTAWQSIHRMQLSSGTGFGPKASGGSTFSGLDQYVLALTDPAFTTSILRVIILGVIQVPLMLALALSLALLLDARRTIGKRSFNLIYFMPYAIPGVVSALMWAFLVQPSLSPFTSIAKALGFTLDMTTPFAIPFTIGNMITWGFTGYNMIIMYSALKALPAEVLEAATIDGAGPWRTAWAIKVPLIRPAVVMASVFSIIGTIQLYTEPAILRNSAPNVDPTFSPVMAVYAAVMSNDFNGAAARSVILALVTLVLSFGFLKYQQRRGGAF
ncbi:sugar ABC transporter permease [Arthrobacter alpinus]|uniref:Sugar ABC transporter permease n=2 Tax=Arthrobacter alpinus TaxID=656366 RepID=A0A0M4QDR1_9MICC|nr:sugar ABC transporter permease [Arthrobacter alpinus]